MLPAKGDVDLGGLENEGGDFEGFDENDGSEDTESDED
jgi:hypothetical protein